MTVILSRFIDIEMSEKTTETVPTGIEGRSNLRSESASALAARELSPMLIVTRSSDVRRSETTTTMVLRSQVRGGWSSDAIPEVGTGPEMEFRHEPEVVNPAEIEVSVSTICGGDLGADRPICTEKLSDSRNNKRVCTRRSTGNSHHIPVSS